MKILWITNIFPNAWYPKKGPFNYEIAQQLARDHELFMIVPIAWTDQLRIRRDAVLHREIEGRLNELRIRIQYPRYYYVPRLLRRCYGTFLWWSVRKIVRRALKTFAPDVVLAYWIHPDGEVAVRVAKQAGVPSVIISGGSDALLLTRDGRRCEKIRRVLELADGIIGVSENLRQKLSSLGVPPEKLHVVPRGVDTTRFCTGDKAAARDRLGIREQANIVLWVGRMVPVKGLDVLLNAVEILHREGVSLRLILIGDGPLRHSMETKVRESGLSNVVSFLGSVSHDRLPDWYRAADVTVLSSHSEGVPNVLRESLACGTPFVATNVGGVSELLGEGSEVVAPNDPMSLASAIRKVLTRDVPEPIASMSLTWSESANRLLSAIRSIMNGYAEHTMQRRSSISHDCDQANASCA